MKRGIQQLYNIYPSLLQSNIGLQILNFKRPNGHQRPLYSFLFYFGVCYNLCMMHNFISSLFKQHLTALADITFAILHLHGKEKFLCVFPIPHICPPTQGLAFSDACRTRFTSLIKISPYVDTAYESVFL